MRRALVAVILLLAVTAYAADDAALAKFHRKAERYAKEGDWRMVVHEAVDYNLSVRTAESSAEAGATLWDLTVKYLPAGDPQRASNLISADTLLLAAVEKDRHNAQAYHYLALLRREEAETAVDPEKRRSYELGAKIMHEAEVDAAQRVTLKPDEMWTVALLQDETAVHPKDADGAIVLRRAPFTIRVVSYGNEAVQITVEGEGVDELLPAGSLRTSREGTLYVFDRDVATLGSTPIEQSTLPRLVVTIVQRRHGGAVRSADEVRRIAVRFR